MRQLTVVTRLTADALGIYDQLAVVINNMLILYRCVAAYAKALIRFGKLTSGLLFHTQLVAPLQF